MSVGLPITKDELDKRSGDLARAFQAHFADVVTLQGYLAQAQEADLITLGYTAQEVATLKSAYNDLSQLGRIWVGQEALATAKDFRTFARQLWGVGAF